MKPYDICVIGNALLDIDIEVSQETIDRLKIQKGVMTLINAERERELLEELAGIKHEKACGGSAANTAVIMSQLGSNVFYSCKVANDEAGDYFLNDLLTYGVATNLTGLVRTAGITGKCLAMITPDADRTMNTFLGVTEHFSVNELNLAAIANSSYLYIEGYLVATPSAFEAALLAAKTAKENNTKIALSLSDPNMITYFREQFTQLIEIGVELLFCNKDEALLYTQQTDILGAQSVLKKFAQQFIITLSDKGSIVYNGSQTFNIAAYETHAVDTTGAGDIFAGAFLYGLLKGYHPAHAADIASLASSKVVARFGSRLPAHEVNNIQQHINKVLTVAAS